MDKSVWEETIGKDADKEDVGPHDRCEGRVCTEEWEGVSVVKGGKRRGKRIYKRTVKKRIHSAIEITINGASSLCREERQKEKNGTGLQVLKQVDSQEQLSTSLNIRYFEEHWDEEGVHKNRFKVGV